MSRRTNSAVWQEAYSRWRVAVQKDGQRRYFYSGTPGRTGQREANRKADAWLEDGIGAKVGRVEDVYKIWLEGLKQTTSASNYEPIESRWRTWVLPIIGKKRVNALTDADLQAIINKAHAAGKSRKTLQSLAGDLRAFCKYCRKSKLSTYLPEDVQIPAGARLKGKKVLQPDDLIKLFTVDTTLYRGKRVPDDFIHAYRFAVLTGLRPGELVGLRWADIKGSTVNVSRAVNVKGQVTRGKNENACRSSFCPMLQKPSWMPKGLLPGIVKACSVWKQSGGFISAGKCTVLPTICSRSACTNCGTALFPQSRRCPLVRSRRLWDTLRVWTHTAFTATL